MINRLRKSLEIILEWLVGTILITLLVIVVMGVVYRKLGHSLVWYDEVASVALAWLTYYGASLAALKRSHIGFSGFIDSFSPAVRLPAVIIGEIIVLAFFILLAYMGYQVLIVLEGDTLVSLPGVSVQITQSVIPIGAALFVIAQFLSFPATWEKAKQGQRLAELH